MKRMILAILGVLTIGVASLAPMPAMAADDTGSGSCGTRLLGFRPWYDGLGCDGGGVKGPEADSTGEKIGPYVWKIVLNITFDLSLAVGYIAVGMVLYGGVMYIMSQGDPGRAAKAQKTLTTAIIGTVIAMGASVIVNTAIVKLHIDQGVKPSGTDQGVKPSGTDVSSAALIKEGFDWAYGMVGLIAVVFIIKSGIDYMTAQGDPAKVQKATRGIIYSAIGLIIAIAATVITGFVIGKVDTATTAGANAIMLMIRR